MELNTIVCGDCVEVMNDMPDGCIDVVFTSPPYWGLRDYGDGTVKVWDGNSDCEHEWGDECASSQRLRNGEGSDTAEQAFDETLHHSTGQFCQLCGAWCGQLGLEPHPQMYINHLVMVFHEVKRILKDSGSLWLNLGDTYYSQPAGNKTPSGFQQGRGDDADKKTAFYDRPVPDADGAWLQPKQLMLIPVRVAAALQEDGWCLRNDVIWRKPNPMPSSVKDRLNNTFEHLFHFVKNRKYYYDLDAIREPHKYIDSRVIKSGGERVPHKDCNWRRQGLQEGFVAYNENGKNPGDVLDVTTQPFPGAHFAVFPLTLLDKPLRATLPREICSKCGHIRERITEIEKEGERDDSTRNKHPQINSMPSVPEKGWQSKHKTVGWSDCDCDADYVGGVVLDPFGGRGTVGRWCKENWGNYIVIDISEEYCDMAHLYINGQKHQIDDDQATLYDCE